MSKVTVTDIQKKKQAREKIVVLTAYDYPTGRLVDQAGVDIVLIGDSLANVALGLASTREVGMLEMLHHARAVSRGVERALLVGDMPYDAYQPRPEVARTNAQAFIDAGCHAVKIEWFAHAREVTKEIIKAGIPVMGHVGLTPQTAVELGGFKVQGKTAESAGTIIEQAKVFEAAGCFSVVLECVPAEVARLVTDAVSIPTISCGAGSHCDGQVLVLSDLIGFSFGQQPKFAKTYIDAAAVIEKGIVAFCDDVRAGRFPDEEHSYAMDPAERKKIIKMGH